MPSRHVRRLFARTVLLVAPALLSLAALTACGGGGHGPADEPAPTGTQLVKVHISSFLGSEGLTLDSDVQPSLFTLDPRIQRVTIEAVNPISPVKVDAEPGTWRPSMTPLTSGNLIPGEIQMLVEFKPATSIGWQAVQARTGAVFASNPSSFLLLRVTGGMDVPLRTINMDTPRTTTTTLGGGVSSESLFLVWRAGNDFGEKGGGSAGFEDVDIVVTEAPLP